MHASLWLLDSEVQNLFECCLLELLLLLLPVMLLSGAHRSIADRLLIWLLLLLLLPVMLLSRAHRSIADRLL